VGASINPTLSLILLAQVKCLSKQFNLQTFTLESVSGQAFSSDKNGAVLMKTAPLVLLIEQLSAWVSRPCLGFAGIKMLS
jgi:hypothetical protein